MMMKAEAREEFIKEAKEDIRIAQEASQAAESNLQTIAFTVILRGLREY